MCGTLKHEERASKLGELVSVLNATKVGCAAWSGHAQQEKLKSFWYPNKCIPVQILVNSFTEKHVEVKVPGGRIQGVGLPHNVSVNGRVIGAAKTTKVVTRAAVSEFEKSIHHRWPVVYYPRNAQNPYVFTKIDVVEKQQSFGGFR